MSDKHGVNHGFNQASAQMDSIAAMVAALEVDYDRLEELEDKEDENKDTVESYHDSMDDWQSNADAVEELEELEDLRVAANGCESLEDAQQRIQEDALSVEIRSGWETVGETLSASEYRIVLCTGGPRVEIVGDLNQHNEPCSARLMYQDWGTGKQEYFGDNLDRDVLITYASQFYFGS